MKILFLFIGFFIFNPIPAFAGEAADSVNDKAWKIWKQNNKQSVSYRPVNINGESLLEIRATAKVKSSLSGFLYFLETVTNTPNWVVNAQESKILSKHSISDTTFYIKMSTMWPFKSRVLLLHSKYWQNDNLSLHIKITDIAPETVKDKMLLHDIDVTEYLQVKVHDAYWKIIPIKANATEIFIEYVFTADGKGEIPTWLADHVALKSIWKSLGNLRRYLPESKWQQNVKVEGITELPN